MMSEINRELLLRYLDRNLSSEDMAQVTSLLRSNPEARAFLREVAEHAVVTADMQRTEQSREIELAPKRARPQSVPKWPWAMAAALIAVIVGVALLRSEPKLAKIKQIHGSVVWTGDGQVIRKLTEGSSVGGGNLELSSMESWVELELRDGSTLTLSGQSVLTLSEQNQQKMLHLRQGRLSANITPQPTGKPLLLLTPTAELQVLGTQFNVDAISSTTLLTVNKGLVRLKRLTDGEMVDVQAEHQVVASIEEQDSLTVARRPVARSSWQSDLKRDAIHGKWTTSLQSLGYRLKKAVSKGKMTKAAATAAYRAAADFGDPTGSLWAMPFIVQQSAPNKAKVMQLVILSVATGRTAPIHLKNGCCFRIRGRMQAKAPMTFGITTHARGGGFAGKYSATRDVEISNEDGSFQFELPMSALRPGSETFGSSTGKELVNCWCFTTEKAALLEITQIELVPPE